MALRSRTSRILGVTIGVAALGAGIGTAALWSRPGDTRSADQANTSASTPREAVRRFLQSEIDGNHADSFTLLAPSEQSDLGDAASWSRRHDELPMYKSFEIDRAEPGVGITTTVELEPRLDEVVGLVPSRARISWATEKVKGGFRVALSRSRLEPFYPSDEGAAPAAREWVRTRQACSKALSYEGNLLGQPSVAESLCGDRATYEPTGTAKLGRAPVTAALANAFGEDSSEWARVVHFKGSRPIDVITAPFGERWVVVGVLENREG